MAVEKAQAQDPAQQPQFTIEKIYVKDLSLEVPNAPQVFLERESPKVDIQLGTRATPLEEGHYEVVLTVTSTAKLGEKTVFLIEAHQAGIFEIRNLPPEQMSPIMGISTNVTRITAWPFRLPCERNRSSIVNLQGRYVVFDKPISRKRKRLV